MALRMMTEKERIKQAWKRWHSSNTKLRYPSFEALIDYCYCLEHGTVHEVDLSYDEMAAIDCRCEPANHVPVYIVEQD